MAIFAMTAAAVVGIWALTELQEHLQRGTVRSAAIPDNYPSQAALSLPICPFWNEALVMGHPLAC